MDIKELKKFLSTFKDSDLEEFKMESEDSKLYFKKGEIEAPAAKVEKAPAVKIGNDITKTPEKKNAVIYSTMVGTFYHAEAADHPPIVLEGNHVGIGQKVGIIEAMKISKTVESHVKGKIVKVLIRNGQPVEYGQELFLVDTEDVK